MARITPVICTAQQCYDYLGITAAQAAANTSAGVTTLASYLSTALVRAAQFIVDEINYDYTTGQYQLARFYGDNEPFRQFGFPVGSITSFKSWDPRQIAAPINIGAGALTIVTSDLTIIYRNDNAVFSQGLEYTIEILQATDEIYGGWPAACAKVQLEMVAIDYRNSENGVAAIGRDEFESSQGRGLRYGHLLPEWRSQLRPYKRFTA